MYPQKLEDFPPPPGVIGSLRAGFEAVSSHVSLILLPAALDILLWLGPRLSADGLIAQARQPFPSLEGLQKLMQLQAGAGGVEEHFNLLSLLGRMPLFPVGVSSLIALKAPVETPFGMQRVIEVQSELALIGLMLLLMATGWITGGVYFHWVSGSVLGNGQRETGIRSLWVILQTLVLSVIWLIGLIVIAIPVVAILVILFTFNPVLAGVAVFMIFLLGFWLVVPLFFIPYGIFVGRQNAFYSIFTSLRMVRFTFPTSGLFVVCVFLLTTGLNYLWSVPPDDSWMKLVGIGGHAFITTALLAASFVYYRDMNVWLQAVFERLQQKHSIPTSQV